MITGKAYWLAKGFLPGEASAFRHITTEGIKVSRHLPVMIATRMSFRREAIRERKTIREYWRSVRQLYVDKGFSATAKALEFDGVKGRRLAFDLFNAYESKYALRDKDGEIIKSPTIKEVARRKPITGKHNIDQMIWKDQDAIKHYRFRLKFETSEYMRASYQRSIGRHQKRIKELKQL